MKKDILQTWFFHQPPAEIWEYLTKPELLEQWLTKTDFQPVVGHKFRFLTKPHPGTGQAHHAYCEVLEVIPQKRLSYSWKKGASEKEISVDSVVTWTLTAKNGGTELQLQHNGFAILEDTLAHEAGWNFCMNKMTELIKSNSNAPTNA